MNQLGPRIVIAGTHSGVGKTSVACGVMAALTRRGVKVAPAKVGPDFIDPGYHALASGTPSRNLDPWMCGEATAAAIAARASAGADVLVVEGVMGLFDGAAGVGEADASTAHVARLLDAPVVLVVDAAAMSRSAAALVHGFATFDPRVRVAGVVLNRVGSDSHEALLREALAPLGVPVLGAIRRDAAFTWRDRHLGLVPVVEQPDTIAAALDHLAGAVGAGVDLDALLTLARTAPTRRLAPPPAPARGGQDVIVAVAAGPAFSFCYPDNVEVLVAAGAVVEPFDPRTAPALPNRARALYAGGGFPEVFAGELAANEPLLADVRDKVAAGLVTLAECGGLLWLSRSLDGARLAGVVDADATMTPRLTLGYRDVRVARDTPLAPAGARLRGHEFHYSALDPPGDALELTGRTGTVRGGYATPTLLASYLHLHFGANPQWATRFVATAAAGRPGSG